MSKIQQNYTSLLQEIQSIKPNAKIVTVTKTQTIEAVLEVIKAGAIIIGENRIQEAEEKFSSLPSSLKKHLIGHLQTNKVNKAVKLFDVIETVDSFHLAQKINQASTNQNKKIEIYLQVNTSGETQKSGILPSETLTLVKQCSKLENIQLTGLMTIAKNTTDSKEIRKNFAELKRLFDEINSKEIPKIKLKNLSMGMTNDYRIALEEGATLVRVGSGIFGQRK